MGGHHIARHAAAHRLDLQLAVLPERDAIPLVQDALFAVDQRVLAVGREAQHRQLPAVLTVIQNVAVVRLLVQAEEEAHPAVQRDAEIPDGLQRKEAGHHRALVVDGATAKEFAAHDLRAVGWVMPALAFGHHVQMAQHRHHLVAGTDLAPADVAVKVGGLKAEFMAEGQRLGETGVHVRAKGFAGQGRSLHAGLADQPLQCRDHLRPQGGNGILQLLVPFAHRDAPSRERRW